MQRNKWTFLQGDTQTDSSLDTEAMDNKTLCSVAINTKTKKKNK